MPSREFIEIGKIIKLSGHSGELIISGPSVHDFFSKKDEPVFIDLNGEFVPFYIEETQSINKEKIVVRFQYVNTEKKAGQLIHKNVSVLSKDGKKSKMKSNLEGMKIIDENFGEVGELKFIDNNSKNPLLVIQNGTTEIFIPYQEEFILGIDEKENVMWTKCPPGLLNLYLKSDEEE